jgi:hypothetical protein
MLAAQSNARAIAMLAVHEEKFHLQQSVKRIIVSCRIANRANAIPLARESNAPIRILAGPHQRDEIDGRPARRNVFAIESGNKFLPAAEASVTFS